MTAKSRPVRKRAEFGFFREIDLFFQGTSPVHQTMRRLVRCLTRAGILHAVVGGMAVYAHGYERTTDDVDILLTAAGFSEFQQLFIPKQYERVPGRARRFIDRKNQQAFDILVAGMFPGSGKPGPIVYPDPETVRERIKSIYFIDLETLIQLKLAARRYQDFADVVALIRAHDLDESFLDRIHASVRQDFIECLEEKRREDEYEGNG